MKRLDSAWRMALATQTPAGAKGHLSIVIFHRVLPTPDPLFPGDPDVQRFDDICAWLAAWYQVLPLDEAAARLARGSLPERALAITFDDGYADNHDLALPILQKYGLCSTFFIATGHLDGGCMWNDIIVEAVRHTRLPELELGGLRLSGVDCVALADVGQRREAIQKLLDACKYLAQPVRQAAAQAIAEHACVTPRSDLMMRSDQVRAMASMGMQIGAHTVTHPILSRLNDLEAENEIAQSKSDLQDLLGQPVTLFAYPNGKPRLDFGARDVALVAKLGFDAAVSTAYGAAKFANASRHQLPRFTPWDLGHWPFAFRLARNLRQPIEVA